MFGGPGSRAGRKRPVFNLANALLSFYPWTIARGGTGQTSQTAAFNALSPTTTRGDLIVQGAANDQRLAIGSNGQVLTSNGTDPVWAAGSPWTTILNTADETRTSTTTVSNSANMAGFSVAANGRYIWRGHLVFGAIGVSAGGYRYTYTGPASPTSVMFGMWGMRAGSNTDIQAATSFGFVLSEAANTNGNILSIFGYLQNGANAGTVQFQWAQNTSSGTATTLLQGSYLEWMQG